MIQHISYCSSNPPEVFISINNNRLQIYNTTNVYMNNGTEFQLEFKNNSPVTQKADIWINGKNQHTSLVLYAGNHVYLDRFMDDNKKLKFDIYDVDNNSEVKKIIENNGLIEVRFYEEIYNTTYYYNVTNTSTSTYYNGLGVGTSTSYISPHITPKGPVGISAKNPSKKLMCDSRTDDTFYNCDSRTDDTFYNQERRTETAKIETGRIAQGNDSDQSFTEVKKTFSLFPSRVVKYKILPMSQLPQTQQEITTIGNIRTYCQSCGRRMKKGWNNCPGCGTKI